MPMTFASFPDTKYRFLFAPSMAGSILTTAPGPNANLTILTPLEILA